MFILTLLKHRRIIKSDFNDARQTDFRPCLTPEIISQGELVYPGESVDMQMAVRKGFIRYYREIARAQQSVRVGSLPYTVKAKGTWKSKSSIEIGEEADSTLDALIRLPNNVFRDCKVVLLFNLDFTNRISHSHR